MQNCDVINKICILLYICSTDSMSNYLDYVEYVNNYAKYEEITVFMNGGPPLFYRKGQLTFFTLCVNVNNVSLATIISLKDVNNIPGVHVTMDTSIEKAMNVIIIDGTIFKVKYCGLRLYYYDC